MSRRSGGIGGGCKLDRRKEVSLYYFDNIMIKGECIFLQEELLETDFKENLIIFVEFVVVRYI